MEPSSKALCFHKALKSCQAIGTSAKELEDAMDANAFIAEHDVPATCSYLAAELSVEEAKMLLEKGKSMESMKKKQGWGTGTMLVSAAGFVD
ncbi:hypothetical protein CBOM_06379 [Ceraceosorus bombacis]|uniref:Uncharacterized protein n=1 Tax=Ceraceosorus bombacis TaxID=401625 RepID=A0A0P1BKV9_9BASI|nr:hypothetical protein CBOM_06379 [Ceraceosorus bombacis]